MNVTVMNFRNLTLEICFEYKLIFYRFKVIRNIITEIVSYLIIHEIVSFKSFFLF